MDNEKKKIVVLQFLREELLNDLEQYGYVEGDVMRIGDPKSDADKHLSHGRHQTMDITQDGNIEIVTRHLDLALARCKEALYPYSKVPVHSFTSVDDVLLSTGTYVIPLLVPEDFSATTVDYLEQLIHNLLIYYVLYYWLSITKPEAAEKWLAMAKSIEEDINGALARVCGKVYRPLKPF